MFRTTQTIRLQSFGRLLRPSAVFLGAGSLMAFSSVHVGAGENQQEDTRARKNHPVQVSDSSSSSLPSFPSILQPTFAHCEKEEAVLPQQKQASDFEFLRDMMLENPILRELKKHMKKKEEEPIQQELPDMEAIHQQEPSKEAAAAQDMIESVKVYRLSEDKEAAAAAARDMIASIKEYTLTEDGEIETVRQKRDREVKTVRDMLLENPNLKPVKYNKGQILHREGELTKGLCIVLDGEISLTTRRFSVSRKHKGDIFGALSLVTEGYGPRRFTARCISPECTIVELGQEEFDQAIAAHPELRKGLRDICLCQEFQRLVVLHTKKHFPKTRAGVKSVFHSIRYSPGTELQLTDVWRVIRSMDRKKTDEDVEEIFDAMDVDGNGGLSEDEFEAIFYEI